MKRIYGYEYFVKKILNLDDLDIRDDSNLLESLQIDLDDSYTEFEIPKKGGIRYINAIDSSSKLYKLQKKLNKNFLFQIPLSGAAIGFVKGNSYIDFLSRHINKKYYMRIDIKDFFGSINKALIEKTFSEFVQDKEIIESITDICMLNDKLPQGAVTSPTISNIVFRRIDQRITKYCQSIQKIRVEKKVYYENITYTRYADDMLFSSDVFDFEENMYFYKMIKNILKENGFNINYNKMHFSSENISLSGFVINKDVHLSRKKMHNINKILYYFDERKKYDESKYSIDGLKINDEGLLDKLNLLNLKKKNGSIIRFESKAEFINYLCGYRAFLISFLKTDNEKTDKIDLINKKVKKIEQLIDILYE